MKSLLRFVPLLTYLTAGSVFAGNRPNVLFIAVDDLRPELGCYGKEAIKSPNIDRLAGSGLVFNRAYCQQAVCAPSRASVMTGTRPDTTKVWDLVTHFRKALPDVVTLGQHFKSNGYFVQGMGKIYHGNQDDAPTWSVPWGTPNATKYAIAENTALDSRPDLRGPAFEAADVPDNTFTDGKTAELAVATLSEISKKPEPFFLAVGFSKPHLPFIAPKKYWDLYDPAKIALAPNKFYPKDAPEYAIRRGANEVQNYEGITRGGSIPDDQARQLRHGYYAAVSYMDAQLGKVLDELERLGLRENTIIVLWGDHGWKLGEHDAWAKHSNSENDTNAPLILVAPGMKRTAGAKSIALVEFVDIYPTLCDLAGLPLPGHLEGVSLKPLLIDPNLPWKSAAFSQYPRPKAKGASGDLMGYSMRTDRYRFTVWVATADHTKIDAVELYDHRSDPQENTNIANDPANNELVQKLMTQWRKGWQGAKP